VGRDYDPVQGQWYEDLDENEIFKVLTLDPDAETVQIQYEDGDVEIIDLDTWHELDLEKAEQPEGWSDEVADDDDDDDDWEEDDEEDDDWEDDDEEDDEDLDDDYNDRDET
jgi:hypothetical protein